MIINHYDWRIHKRLEEARRVYICPARGNGKFERTREMYEELIDQGKEITFVRTADLPKKDQFKIHKELLDMDLCSNHEPHWREQLFERFIKEEIDKKLLKYTEDWKPKFIIDTVVPDDRFFYDWKLCSLGSLYSVGVLTIEED